MSSLIVAKYLFDGRTPLPNVCIGCGKPATGETTIRMAYGGPTVTGSPGNDSELGCLLNILFFGLMAGSLAAREVRFKLSAPVCRYHGWISRPAVEIVADHGDTVELKGVSPEFVVRLAARRDGTSG